MATTLILVIYALLPTLVSLLTEGAVHCMLVIMDTDLLKFSSSNNMLQILDDILRPLASRLNFNIGEFIFVLAIIFTVMFMVLGVINSMIQAHEGEISESPIKLFIRGIVTLGLLFIIFGNPIGKIQWFSQNGLLWHLGNAMSKFLAPLTTDLKAWADGLDVIDVAFSLRPSEQIVLIVLSFSLFKGTIEAALVFVERFLSFAFSILVGPLAIAFNVNKSTADTFKQWVMSVFGQYVTILISMIILNMFLFQIKNGMGSSLALNNATSLFGYVLAIVLLSLYKNSEKFLNSWGIRTIMNRDSLNDLRKGSMAVGSMARMLTLPLFTSLGRKSVGEITHGINQKARRFNHNPATPLAKEFDTTTLRDHKALKNGIGVDANSSKFATEPHNTNTDSRMTNTLNRANNMVDSAKNVSALHRNQQLAANNVNKALDQGVGTSVSMKQVALASGLSNKEDMNISPIGKVAQLETPEGNKNAIIFKAQSKTDSGVLEPKSYAMVFDDKPLKPTDEIRASSSQEDLKYRINPRSEALSMNNDSGFVYEVEQKERRAISKKEFEATPEMSETYGSYKDYRDDLQQKRYFAESYDNELSENGYQPAWQSEIYASTPDIVAKKVYGETWEDKTNNDIPEPVDYSEIVKETETKNNYDYNEKVAEPESVAEYDSNSSDQAQDDFSAEAEFLERAEEEINVNEIIEHDIGNYDDYE